MTPEVNLHVHTHTYACMTFPTKVKSGCSWPHWGCAQVCCLFCLCCFPHRSNKGLNFPKASTVHAWPWKEEDIKLGLLALIFGFSVSLGTLTPTNVLPWSWILHIYKYCLICPHFPCMICSQRQTSICSECSPTCATCSLALSNQISQEQKRLLDLNYHLGNE